LNFGFAVAKQFEDDARRFNAVMSLPIPQAYPDKNNFRKNNPDIEGVRQKSRRDDMSVEKQNVNKQKSRYCAIPVYNICDLIT
jgi:hypothetical protein